MMDLIVLGAVLGLLLVSALVLIWWNPKSAEYVGTLLWRRACALEASRFAYKAAWADTGIEVAKVQETASLDLRHL